MLVYDWEVLDGMWPYAHLDDIIASQKNPLELLCEYVSHVDINQSQSSIFNHSFWDNPVYKLSLSVPYTIESLLILRTKCYKWIKRSTTWIRICGCRFRFSIVPGIRKKLTGSVNLWQPLHAGVIAKAFMDECSICKVCSFHQEGFYELASLKGNWMIELI